MSNRSDEIVSQFYADMLNSADSYRGNLDDSLSMTLDELYKIYSDDGKILFWDEMRMGYPIPAPNPLDFLITWSPQVVPPVFEMPQVDEFAFSLDKVALDSCFK